MKTKSKERGGTPSPASKGDKPAKPGKKSPKVQEVVPKAPVDPRAKWLKMVGHIEWPEEHSSEATDVAFWKVWTSRCGRYRIVRSIHKYDGEDRRFVAGFGQKVIIDGEGHKLWILAALACQRHLSRSVGKDTTSNCADVERALGKLAELPSAEERPPLRKPSAAPETPRPKPVVRKKGEISDFIRKVLQGASKKSPVSLKQILEKCVAHFPEREKGGMEHTVYVQVCSREHSRLWREGLVVKGNRFVGFWAEG